MSVLFVGEPWTSTITKKGVFITYRSEDEVFERFMLRSDYRRGLEIELRRLNEYERRERCEVVAIGERQHG